MPTIRRLRQRTCRACLGWGTTSIRSQSGCSSSGQHHSASVAAGHLAGHHDAGTPTIKACGPRLADWVVRLRRRSIQQPTSPAVPSRLTSRHCVHGPLQPPLCACLGEPDSWMPFTARQRRQVRPPSPLGASDGNENRGNRPDAGAGHRVFVTNRTEQRSRRTTIAHGGTIHHDPNRRSALFPPNILPRQLRS